MRDVIKQKNDIVAWYSFYSEIMYFSWLYTSLGSHFKISFSKKDENDILMTNISNPKIKYKVEVKLIKPDETYKRILGNKRFLNIITTIFEEKNFYKLMLQKISDKEMQLKKADIICFFCLNMNMDEEDFFKSWLKLQKEKLFLNEKICGCFTLFTEGRPFWIQKKKIGKLKVKNNFIEVQHEYLKGHHSELKIVRD